MDNAIINLFLKYYFYIAFFLSLFYSFFGEKIFIKTSEREQIRKDFGNWVHIREFWVRFVGLIIGWYSLYLFISITQKIGAENISFSHIMLLIIGVIGIVGWLPYTLTGVIDSLAGIVKKLVDKI